MLNLQINMTINERHIGLQIQSNQPKIYAIQGVSGIGKTTLLNVIAVFVIQIMAKLKLMDVY